MKWNDNGTISITPPARPKKCTGTRLAAIMGAEPVDYPVQCLVCYYPYL